MPNPNNAPPPTRQSPHLRAHEQPLEQDPQGLPADAAGVDPDPGRRQPRRHGPYQIRAPRHVAAARRERAAAVFDEGAHRQVGAHRGGLARVCELAVAVVDDDDDVGVLYFFWGGEGWMDGWSRLMDARRF